MGYTATLAWRLGPLGVLARGSDTRLGLSASVSYDQSVVLRPADRFRAVMRMQLAIRATCVLLDRVGRERQVRRDLIIGLAAGDSGQDLLFAHREVRHVAGQLRRGEPESESGQSHRGDDLLDPPRLRDEAARAQSLKQARGYRR